MYTLRAGSIFCRSRDLGTYPDKIALRRDYPKRILVFEPKASICKVIINQWFRRYIADKEFYLYSVGMFVKS